MSEKKIIIILVNILFLLLLLILFNYLAYFQYMKTIEPRFYNKDTKFTVIRTPFNYENWNNQRIMRSVFGSNYHRKGFTIFGCSYGYGFGLKDNQTFSYKLSNLTKRPVYTLAEPGTSAQYAILDVQSNKYNDYIKNSDYAIYMVISEHLWRILTHCGGQFTADTVWPKFDDKNGKLVLHKTKFPSIEGSYLYRATQKSTILHFIQAKNEYVFNWLFDLFKMHIKLLNTELKKRNPHIKLIIFIYKDYDNEVQKFTNTPRWKEIEDMGITVVSAEDLARKKNPNFDIMAAKYRIPNDGHPNEESWNILTPLFVSAINPKL